MRKFLAGVAMLCGLLLGNGCGSLHLSGSVSGTSYISSRGHFSVPIPVSPEINGRVQHDTGESVTFHDNWGSQITFSSAEFSANSSMTEVLQKQGREKALEAFAREQYGDMIVPHYHADVREGSITLIFLRPVGPKTGVAAFISGDRIYWVTTDLLPAVQLLSQTDDASQHDRDDWLENRALELLKTMQLR